MKTNLFRNIKLPLLGRGLGGGFLLLWGLGGGCALMAQAPVDLQVCYGKSYTLNSTAAAGGEAPVTYQWYENGEPVDNSDAPTLNIAEGKEPGDYAYVRVAANAACTLSSNTYTVTVISSPTNLSLTPSPTAVCTGNATTLTAYASGAASYSLDGTNWQPEAEFQVFPESPMSYTLYVTTTTGCTTTLPDAAAVTVNPVSSVPSAPTQNGPKCAGTGITFSATKPDDATGLDWTGSVSGQGTSKTTATTAGNYSAQVRSYLTSGEATCYSEWTSTVSGTITAIPSVPSTPSQNGPTCAGTGITFSATKPDNATGLDWTGSVSGTGTSKTTATTAGNYSAQVRSYLTSGGTTCYSGWSGTANGTINSPAGRDQAPNTCGCASNLTACNGYCRDLGADAATCYNNLEISIDCWSYDHIFCSTPGGWSVLMPNRADAQALHAILCGNYQQLYIWVGENNSTHRVRCNGYSCTPVASQTEQAYWLKYR